MITVECILNLRSTWD